MTKYFDSLETRSDDERIADLSKELPSQIKNAKENSKAFQKILNDVDYRDVGSLEDLTRLPVLRKSELVKLQAEDPPLGGLIAGSVNDLNQIFQSPGPIYEPGMTKKDWWRSARALNAAGIGKGDIVQNCFSYHFTPAGMLSEQGILAVGATVFPAGTGQTELQARAASEIGVTAYIGVPDFLQIILEHYGYSRKTIIREKVAIENSYDMNLNPKSPNFKGYYMVAPAVDNFSTYIAKFNENHKYFSRR